MLKDKKYAFPTKYWEDLNKWSTRNQSTEAIIPAHSNLGRTFNKTGHTDSLQEFKQFWLNPNPEANIETYFLYL
jgi:hypothetical protein